MSFWEILDTLLLKPLQLIFEIIYMLADKATGNSGASIIVLSIFINLLVLPLYMCADKIQEEERALERKLQKGVEHIKKTFSGDERMMMLQTYYRQNQYKPVYVLRSAVSLFLQIPFFIAAYRFLSGLQLLNGKSFGLIPDLGRADGILLVAGVSVNVLPIIMTVVNLMSCVIFTKESPLREKIQLYAMALFFLVFLYTSPAGLVFYWTLNNVFSLVKTIFYKLRNPGKILGVLFSIGGVILAVYILFFYQRPTMRRLILLGSIAVAMQLPLLYSIVKKHVRWKNNKGNGSTKVFFMGGLFLAILTGALIPSAVIKASTQEFMDITYFYNPLWLIVSSFCLAFGIFVIWGGVFYFLAKTTAKAYMNKIVWFLSGIFVLDYMFFGKDLGLMTSRLQYENELEFAGEYLLKNLIAVILLTLVFNLIYRYHEKLAADIMLVGALSLIVMTAINMTAIGSAANELKERNPRGYEEIPGFTLSRTGKNIIVLMLDQAMGEYIPYIFYEKPELQEQFKGFTYYANTVSFGGNTNFGAPAVFGGYEYTPVEMNKRDEELLVDKHNEALKVMPVLFGQNGYQVMVCDLPYGNYQWITDLSIYDEYSEIQHYILGAEYRDIAAKEEWVRDNKRNFFCYGILKASPLCVQKVIYDRGRYNQAKESMGSVYEGQVRDGIYKATGLKEDFMIQYDMLTSFSDITNAVDENINTFLVMVNEITHAPMLLQEPDYIPAMEVDNTIYESEHSERYSTDGQVLKMSSDNQLIYYHTNMAAIIQLGKWFDYLRKEGVYDNTRIILVADHGKSGAGKEDGTQIEGGRAISSFYPLLMVKDFDSEEFIMSEEFMTHADVPTIAVKDIIEEPINPFTGKMIDMTEKTAHDQYIISSPEWSIEVNNGKTFLPARWYAVHDDMRDPDNWELLNEKEAILPPTKN